MKNQYQIEAQRAVKELEAMAADENPAVQMVLPMAEMVGWLRKGVGELIRQAGLQLRSEEHTSELQSLRHLVCRLLLEKKQGTWHWICGLQPFGPGFPDRQNQEDQTPDGSRLASFFFLNERAPPETYPLSLPAPLPI